jgi:hypothetical protein
MATPNNYLDGAIPFFYRRQALDLMIHAFISAYQNAFPSITKAEAAASFLKCYNIATDLYDIKTVIAAFDRTNNDLINASKKR